MKTPGEFLIEHCGIPTTPTPDGMAQVKVSQVIKAMIDFSHQQNENPKMYPVPEYGEIAPMIPTELRIKEKALECLKSGECDSYNNPEELFVAGAIWMRKMLIGK